MSKYTKFGVSALALAVVVGTGLTINASAKGQTFFKDESVVAAIESGNIDEFKAAAIAAVEASDIDNQDQKIAKIESIDEERFEQIQTRFATKQEIQELFEEYKPELTEAATNKNEEAFTTSAREFLEQARTIVNDSGATTKKNADREITDEILERMYNRAVEQVENGEEVSLKPERSGKRGGRSGGQRQQ